MSDNKFKGTYRIPSARAQWHDYEGGEYFVTICTQNREHFFGEIVNGEMRLSEVGKMFNGTNRKNVPDASRHEY